MWCTLIITRSFSLLRKTKGKCHVLSSFFPTFRTQMSFYYDNFSSSTIFTLCLLKGTAIILSAQGTDNYSPVSSVSWPLWRLNFYGKTINKESCGWIECCCRRQVNTALEFSACYCPWQSQCQFNMQ